MTSIGLGARRTKNTDFDAAQALLDLQSNENPEGNAPPYASSWRDAENKEELEKAAKLILSCFISSDVSVSTKKNPHGRINRNTAHFMTPNSSKKSSPHYKSDGDPFKISPRSLSFNNSISSNRSTPIDFQSHGPAHPSIKTQRKSKTRDAGTQTEEEYFNPNIQLMETTIKNLCDRIKSLEAQINTSHSEMTGHLINDASFGTVDQNPCFPPSASYENSDPDYEMSNTDETINESKYSRTSEFDNSSYNESFNGQTNKNVMYNGILASHNKNSMDMVPIGDGNASVPSRLLKNINWNSYSSATRKLLTAVFSRKILATHSLTGKPSPAFPNKPAKKRLDPSLVNDIVQTVVERCRVPENVVRTSITTKCADESKMFRTREKNKKKRTHKKNRENVPPATSDSEFDDY